jgi:hypothetical protein
MFFQSQGGRLMSVYVLVTTWVFGALQAKVHDHFEPVEDSVVEFGGVYRTEYECMDKARELAPARMQFTGILEVTCLRKEVL